MKKNNLVKALLSLLLFAADQPSFAGNMASDELLSPTWRNLYLGGQLGGAWTQQNWEYRNLNYFNTIGSSLLGTQFSLNPSNIIGGGYAGINFQSNSPWLLGVEGSFSGANLSKTQASPFYTTDRYTSSMNELASVKGRLGYVNGGWLSYVTGGGAFANTSLTLADHLYNVLSTTTPWNSGWTLGAGVDYRLTQHLAVGLTYDYSDISFNTQTMSCPNCNTGLGQGTPVVNGDFIVQSVMARFSYLL